MSVDMFEWRFRQELEKLPTFEPDDNRISTVWRADFPAWRALFTSLLLWGHSTGYRLPSFDDFYSYCERAWLKGHPSPERFKKYFSGRLKPGMVQRAKFWYESGMSETHLYVCLVEAIEDELKKGLVLYDPRADWKLKMDVFVFVAGHRFRINAFHGETEQRGNVEAHRDRVERQRKVNTAQSSHWGNLELDNVIELQVAKSDDDVHVVNGVRLFPYSSINACLQSIYASVGIRQGIQFPLR